MVATALRLQGVIKHGYKDRHICSSQLGYQEYSFIIQLFGFSYLRVKGLVIQVFTPSRSIQPFLYSYRNACFPMSKTFLMQQLHFTSLPSVDRDQPLSPDPDPPRIAYQQALREDMSGVPDRRGSWGGICTLLRIPDHA